MVRRILRIAAEATAGQCPPRTAWPADCEVSRVADAPAGVRAAIAGGFDLVCIEPAATPDEALEILGRIRLVSPAPPVVILSRKLTVEAAVAAIRAGAADYLAEPDSPESLDALLRCCRSAAGPPVPADVAAGGPVEFEGMLGQCTVIRDVFDLIRRIAPADSTVLVQGESGTGKEMAVRAIHRLSRRGGQPLLACDCTALAPTLLESELFGHVKGSFSGAIATKKGLFEVAHLGTLFLDEVANLSQETQGKLLRVLETRRVRKVGDTAEHEVDIRLIATTNRSLAEMVKTGEFRADLYYRLNVVPVVLPPLRLRRGDLPLLAANFLDQFSRQLGAEPRGFSCEAVQQMEVYSWPGNVRELRNIVERLAVLYSGTRIELANLPWEIREAHAAADLTAVPDTWDDLKRTKRGLVEDLERRFLAAALRRCGQNVTQAAESVGMQRSNFHALLKHYGIKSESRSER